MSSASFHLKRRGLRQVKSGSVASSRVVVKADAGVTVFTAKALQVWIVAAWSVELDLRVALFFGGQSMCFCSACVVPLCTVTLQESSYRARLSHNCLSIPTLFMYLLQVSLKRSLGCSVLCPNTSVLFMLIVRPNSSYVKAIII